MALAGRAVKADTDGQYVQAVELYDQCVQALLYAVGEITHPQITLTTKSTILYHQNTKSTLNTNSFSPPYQRLADEAGEGNPRMSQYLEKVDEYSLRADELRQVRAEPPRYE